MRQFLAAIVLILVGCSTTGGPPIHKAKMAEGYYMKGLSHLQEKNYELASVEFNRSIQTDEKFKSSYYCLGLISADQGKLDNAIMYYKEALDIDSNYSEANNALATVYSRQQNWKDALKYYKKALENKLYTTPHVPYLNMGRVYMAQKDYDKAIEAYRDAKRFANQDFVIYELGTAFFEAGKIKDSIAVFQEGITIAPQNANIRYSLGVAMLRDGNRNGALAQFKKASELAPGTDISVKANDYMKTLR